MRLNYANVTSSIALFVALGGTSYAVAQIPRNSVGSTQVRDGSLQRKDLAPAAVPTTRGPRGAQGPSGPPGSQGVQGERGPSTVRIARQAASVSLSGAVDVQTQVRRMDNVPAGSWVLRFQGSPRLSSPTALHTFCLLKVNGDVVATGATVVGDNANATQEATIIAETAVDRSSAFNVTVDCYQNGASSPVVVINRPQIIATQAADIVTTP